MLCSFWLPLTVASLSRSQIVIQARFAGYGTKEGQEGSKDTKESKKETSSAEEKQEQKIRYDSTYFISFDMYSIYFLFLFSFFFFCSLYTYTDHIF